MESRLARVTKISFVLLLILFSKVVPATDFPRISVELNGKVYVLEVADNDLRRRQGLMYRTTLEKDHGMLFVYKRTGRHGIWMKNTLLPLTVLWLDEQAQIVDKKLLKPCKSWPCPVYGADNRSRYIVELHAHAYPHFKYGEQLSELVDWSSHVQKMESGGS